MVRNEDCTTGLLWHKGRLKQIPKNEKPKMNPRQIRQIIIKIMEYTHTHTHKYTQEQSLNNPTKINYSGLTWQIKEIKKLYLPVKNKTN